MLVFPPPSPAGHSKSCKTSTDGDFAPKLQGAPEKSRSAQKDSSNESINFWALGTKERVLGGEMEGRGMLKAATSVSISEEERRKRKGC